MRKAEKGERCYQHNIRLNSSFPEKYSIIAKYLDDKIPFLESLPKGVDPNLIILDNLKYGPPSWPLTLFVGGKKHSFTNLEKALGFIEEKYNQDLYPLLIKSIRQFGTKNKATNPKNNERDTDFPYGFRYYLGKSLYLGTPAVSTVSIKYKYPYDIDGTIDDTQLTLINDYIQTVPLLPKILKRGDLIYNDEYGGYRNDGILIWDGKKALDLDTEEDEYGAVPSEFKTLTEFPFGYFYDNYGKGSMGIDHNFIQWMDLTPYAEQAKENFDGKDSFIDVKEIVDGKERTVRIYLTILMYDDHKEVPTIAEDYRELLIQDPDDYYNTDIIERREISVERTVGEDARLG